MVRVMRVRVFANHCIRCNSSRIVNLVPDLYCLICLAEVSGFIDKYIASGGKRDVAEIIKHGLNEEGNKQVQYVSSDGKSVLTEQIVYKLVNLLTSTELINLDPVSRVWFSFLFKDPVAEVIQAK